MTKNRMLRWAVIPLFAAAVGTGGCSTSLLGNQAVANAARSSVSSFLTQVAQVAIDGVLGG